MSCADSTIACQMVGDDLPQRRQEMLTTIWPLVQERAELEDGYAFRFPGADKIARQLLDFIIVERQCCPFFQIELAFTPENGPTWLRLRGGEEVKRFLETEMADFTAV